MKSQEANERERERERGEDRLPDSDTEMEHAQKIQTETNQTPTTSEWKE